jgi:hypothetical protein
VEFDGYKLSPRHASVEICPFALTSPKNAKSRLQNISNRFKRKKWLVQFDDHWLLLISTADPHLQAFTFRR